MHSATTKRATYLVRVRAKSKVLDSLAGVLRASEEQSVGTSGSTQGKLIQSKDLTTSLLNAGAGGGSEAQGSNRQLGDGQEAVVVGDGTNHNHGLALLGLSDIRGDTGERHRGAVDARHKETTKNSLVEVRLRATCEVCQCQFRFQTGCLHNLHRMLASGSEGVRTSQEAVQLHQNLQVNIVALGSLAVGAAHMVTVQVDT